MTENTATATATAKGSEAPAKLTPAEVKANTYANGIRKAREARGYSRIEAAKALGISTTAYWNLEYSSTIPANHKAKTVAQFKAALTALPLTGNAAKKAEKAAAAKKAGKATPAKAEGSDLL